MGILPVALIQDQPLIKGPAVEQDVRSFYCDLPHAEIGHYLILILSRFQGAVQVVKVRLLRLPLQDPPLSEIFLITENIQPGPPMSSGYRSLHTRNIPSLKAGFQIQKTFCPSSKSASRSPPISQSISTACSLRRGVIFRPDIYIWALPPAKRSSRSRWSGHTSSRSFPFSTAVSSGLADLIRIFCHNGDPVFSPDKKLCHIKGKSA